MSIPDSANPVITRLLGRAAELLSRDEDGAAIAAFAGAMRFDQTGVAQNAFAKYLFRREYLDRSIAIWNRLLQRVGASRLRAEIEQNLAAAYRSRGEWHVARTFQQRAIGRLQRENALLTVRELAGLAHDAIALQDWDHAESLLNCCLRSDDGDGYAVALALRGVLASRRGDAAPAMCFLWKAYRAHRRIDDRVGAGAALLNLGELYEARDDLQLAEHCLVRAVELLEEARVTVSVHSARWRAQRVRLQRHQAGQN